MAGLLACQQRDNTTQVTEATTGAKNDAQQVSPYTAFADSLAATRTTQPADLAAARALAADMETWQAADRPAAIKQHPAAVDVFDHSLRVLRLAVRTRNIPLKTEQETVNRLFSSAITKQAQARKELLVITLDGGPTDLAGAASTIDKTSQIASFYKSKATQWFREFVNPSAK